MKFFRVFLFVLVVCAFTTGCWDSSEMNSWAFWLGTSLDLTQDGELQMSGQFAVPPELGGQRARSGKEGKGYYVESATGKDLYDAELHIQEMLPRRIFIGHRRSIFIGERLAKHGLTNLMDEYARNPESLLRSDIFVVLGRQARDFLEVEYPFEHFSSMAAVDQDKFCRTGDTNLRNLLLDTASDATCPMVSTLEMIPKSVSTDEDDKYVLWMRGTAVFDRNLKMVTVLKGKDSMNAVWIAGRLSHQILTENLTEGTDYISIDVVHLRSKIIPHYENGRFQFRVVLYGDGLVRENNTSLDLSEQQNVELVQANFQKQIREEVIQTIEKVKPFGTDIFGFGESIRRTYPYQWLQVRQNWSEIFKRSSATVEVKVTIQRPGVTGASVQMSNPSTHQSDIY